MKRSRHAFYLLLISIFSFHCQKELSFKAGGAGETPASGPVRTTIQGNIVDENNRPVSGALTRVGSRMAYTDTRGYFRCTDVSLDRSASLVTVEKAGYFKAYRTFQATSGTNQVMIKLQKRSLSGSVNAQEDGVVALSGGAKILLPAGGVVNAASGQAYAGTVSVYARFIDPTATDIAQTVPGSFMADDKNNQRVTLASYGMMAVELEGTSGEKLQIRPGSTARLTMPIPASILPSAPEIISLWYVDEASGIWKEEGQAKRTGNSYVGEVKHFSFWNCDIGVPAVTLSLRLSTKEGLALVHALVKVTRKSNGFSSQTYGWTDSLGQVSGLVPSNEDLALDVLDDCNHSVYSQSIGKLTRNTDLGIVILPAMTSGLVTVKGKLVNCSNNAVSNGFAVINFENRAWHAKVDANGNYALSFVYCAGGAADLSVLGVDAASSQEGKPTNIAITLPVTNGGTLSACGSSAAEYVNFTLDDTSNNITAANGDSLFAYAYKDSFQVNAFRTRIIAIGNNGPRIIFSFTSTAVTGTYPVESLELQNFNSPWDATLIQPFNVVITNYPQNAAAFYEGSISGQFRDAQNKVHTLSGKFRVRRY